MIKSVHANPSQATSPPPLSRPAHVLQEDIARSASRGRKLNAARQIIFTFSVLVTALLLLVGIDAIYPMPGVLRIALLLSLLLAATLFGAVLIVRQFLSRRYTLGTAERIDQVSEQNDQPVIRGVSLMPTEQEDRLASILRERAEQRAADSTAATPPKRVYPLRRLFLPSSALFCAVVLWIVLANIFPAQFGGMLSRIVLPWGGAPPFSFTQLDPTWTPKPPTEGDDVTISVQPEGKPPEEVDFVRLDEDGQELERFAMTAGLDNRFFHQVVSIDAPVHFHLETRGRPSRQYTIEPLPKPGQPADPDSQGDDRQGDSSTTSRSEDAGGTTRYDPAAAAKVVRDAHEDWPKLREQIESLLGRLNAVQAKAESIDPNDRQATEALEGELSLIEAQARALAEDVKTLQADLPSDAAATLAGLLKAIEGLQSTSLGSCPHGGGEANTPGDSSGQPANQPATPQQWLDRVGESAGADTKQLASGLGHSSAPTESGTTSGRPDGNAPQFDDPAAVGTSDEQGVSSDTGPLPPAVMQQVPPSYRDHIRAYFNELSETETQP